MRERWFRFLAPVGFFLALLLPAPSQSAAEHLAVHPVSRANTQWVRFCDSVSEVAYQVATYRDDLVDQDYTLKRSLRGLRGTSNREFIQSLVGMVYSSDSLPEEIRSQILSECLARLPDRKAVGE